MLYGNLRGFAEALISRNKYKAEGELRELADAIISGNKYKAPSGQLRDLADAIIHRDKYRVASGPLQDFANALITGDKYKAPSELRDLADAIVSGDKYKVSSGGCYIATATLGHAAYDHLNVLRQFRDETLLSTTSGRITVAYYRIIGHQVARYISTRPFLRASFLYPFIIPATKLLKDTSHRNCLKRGMLYVIFFFTLLWASMLTLWISLNKKSHHDQE